MLEIGRSVAISPEDQKGHHLRRGSRGGRQYFETADYKNRDIISCCQLKQWRAIATRYDKRAFIYRTATILHSMISRAKAFLDTS